MSGIAFAGFWFDCACAGGCARSAIAARFAFTGAGSVVRIAAPGELDVDPGCAAGCATGATAEFAARPAVAGDTPELEDVAGRFMAGGADSIRALDFAPGNTWK